MNISPINNVRIVLIGTTHPGNIGAAARAMKAMGITDLVLVDPQAFPHPEADARATSALDVVQSARVVQSLHEAIEDCSLAIATSSQLPSLRWPEIPIRNLGEKVLSSNQEKPVAIVFGRERTGMHIEEIQQCQFLVQIPSNPECRSLNLAAAVQIICYEIMMAQGYEAAPARVKNEYGALPSVDDIDRFHKHMFATLEEIGFINANNPKLIKQRLKRLFAKAELDQNELNIMRGIFTAVDKK